MSRLAIVRVEISLHEEAVVTFGDAVEVSLDCHVCQRRKRTINFKLGDKDAMCIQTQHRFPGRIVDRLVEISGRTAIATYDLAYEYEPFTDSKYPDEARYRSKERGAPTWGRVSFSILCPSCRSINPHSTQTNIVRPWTLHCRTCGSALYTEVEVMPRLSWRPFNPT